MFIFRRISRLRPPGLSLRHLHTPSAAPELRKYQKECISACLDALKSGKRRIAVSLATGGGKTVIFANLLNQIAAEKTGNKVLILTHRKELATQAQSQISRFNPDLKVEIEMGATKADPSADVIVAGVQTLQGKRLEQLDPEDFKAIIIDEAHHAASQSYLNIIQHFKATKAKSKVAVIGFTATLFRTDTKSLTKAFDHVVYDLSFMDMINDGWLSSVRFSTVISMADLTEVEIGAAGDFKTSSLSKVVNTDKMNSLVFRTWKNMTQKHGYKSTIVFCVDVQHVKDLVELFRAQGVNAEGVTGTTKPKTRESIIEEFKNGDIPVIFNCGVFTEGTDIPNIDLVILNRPTKSKGLMMQMIGRGLRLHPGKDHTAVVDLVGTVPAGMVTAPSLLGLPSGYQCSRASFEELLEEKKKTRDPDHVQITTFSSLQDFLDFGREIQDVEVEEGEYGEGFANPDNWMHLTPNSWALDKGSRGTSVRLTIIPDSESMIEGENKVKASLITMGIPPFGGAKRWNYFGKTGTLMEGVFDSKKDAFDAAAKSLDNAEYLPEMQIWAQRMTSRPASEAQKKFLKKLVDKSLYMRQSADVAVLMKGAQKALETKTPVELTEKEFLALRAKELKSFVDNIDLDHAKLWISRLKMTSGELSRIYKASNVAQAQKAYKIMVDPVGEPSSLVGELKNKRKDLSVAGLKALTG
ncbi:putative ATP-dependent helicase IRC3 [Yarrowia sp. C11]|nr:putative ATP-dependent helicase IRC3 [Yarrowia sp. C11]